jgi:hypothetical protein
MKLGVWSVPEGRWRSTVSLSEPAGTIMPWKNWVIAFHESPRAIEVATGKVVHRWSHLFSGRQIGSIELGEPAPPQMALDPGNGRFAIAGPNGVSVVTLGIEPNH